MTIKSGLQNLIKRAVPPQWIAAFEFYVLRNPPGNLPEPLNGQKHRRAIIDQIIRNLAIERIVETGSFRAATTSYLAQQYQLPIATVEVNPRFYHYARWRTADMPCVDCNLGDSRSFLRKLAEDEDATRQCTLFYLDAHWHNDLPLAEELRIITDAWPRAAIVIDDFQVPDDPGYRYDDYGPDNALTAELLAPAWRDDLLACYPAARSETETGFRRGCVAIFTAPLADDARKLDSLRVAERFAV